MGLITVVRHGQAGSFAKRYDQLSELGREQSRRLGEHWADHGIGWDRVFIGPRQRHSETEQAVAKVYRDRGLPWPEPELLTDLDEINMAAVLSHLAGRRSGLARDEALHLHEVPEHERPAVLKKFFVLSRKVTLDYAAGRIAVPDVETWEQFKARARRALDTMAASGKGQRVLAFSSGGLTGMLAACALEITDEKSVDLMSFIRNGSYTSFAYTGRKQTLVSFNSVPHLAPGMWTLA